MDSDKTAKLSFEAALAKLETIVDSMESGEVPLAERVGGPWDEAWQTDELRGTYRESTRLVVRVDNLVLVVQLSFSGEDRGLGQGEDVARGAARQLARDYLAEVRTTTGKVPATP